MITTVHPICGVSLGFQFTEGETESGVVMSILLIDLLIITIQFSWIQ
jgi:hypothetical protein